MKTLKPLVALALVGGSLAFAQIYPYPSPTPSPSSTPTPAPSPQPTNDCNCPCGYERSTFNADLTAYNPTDGSPSGKDAHDKPLVPFDPNFTPEAEEAQQSSAAAGTSTYSPFPNGYTDPDGKDGEETPIPKTLLCFPHVSPDTRFAVTDRGDPSLAKDGLANKGQVAGTIRIDICVGTGQKANPDFNSSNGLNADGSYKPRKSFPAVACKFSQAAYDRDCREPAPTTTPNPTTSPSPTPSPTTSPSPTPSPSI